MAMYLTCFGADDEIKHKWRLSVSREEIAAIFGSPPDCIKLDNNWFLEDEDDFDYQPWI